MSNFELTLNLIQTRLNQHLIDGYHRIWVQGCNTKETIIMFTIFNRDGYKMEFLKVRNFRQYRPNSENQEEEREILERNIRSFRTSISEYVDFDNL